MRQPITIIDFHYGGNSFLHLADVTIANYSDDSASLSRTAQMPKKYIKSWTSRWSASVMNGCDVKESQRAVRRRSKLQFARLEDRILLDAAGPLMECWPVETAQQYAAEESPAFSQGPDSSRTALQSQQVEPRTFSGAGVSLEAVELLAKEGLNRWRLSGLDSDQLEVLQNLSYHVADLQGHNLARIEGRIITVDDSAAGSLWYVDLTPGLDEEFADADGKLHANAGSMAAGKMDLLTAIMHEQGHALGGNGISDQADVMHESLETGERRLPFEGQTLDFSGAAHATSQYLTSSTTGSGETLDARQPYGSANYAIALTGLSPTQSGSDTFGTPYIGEIVQFAGNFAPSGHAMAEGQLLAIASHSELYSVIGTTFGGDGQSTFALPDLRGRTPIGAGEGIGLLPIQVGQEINPVSLTVQQLPAHVHEVEGHETSPAGSSQSHSVMMPSLGLTPIMDNAGEIRWFAGNSAPVGTYLVNGQVMLLGTIPVVDDLFEIIGATYGGDGVSRFHLPDLRGRIAIGAGDNGTTNYALGAKSGVNSYTLTTDNLPSHQHGVPGTTGTTTASGADAPYSIVQPSLAVNYQIVDSGIFPSESLAADGQDALLGSAFDLELDTIELFAQEGIARWTEVGISSEMLAELQGLQYQLADLQPGVLASASANDVISIDRDAAGFGWFVDASPEDDAEFTQDSDGFLRGQTLASQAGFDLLTAIMHEQGHALGLGHDFENESLMDDALPSGQRRLPSALDLDTASDEHSTAESLTVAYTPTMARVHIFAGSEQVDNFLPTGGQLINISQNTALFSIVGVTYGGDGQTQFRLPDFRGRAVVGVGQGPGLENVSLGQTGGAEALTLSVSQLPAHSHEVADISLQVSANSISEGTPDPITVTASALGTHTVARQVVVSVSGVGVTANDYSLPQQIIEIPANELAGSVNLFITDDAIIEGTETLTLTIVDPATGLSTQQVIELADNDATGQVQTTIRAASPDSGLDEISVQTNPDGDAIVDVDGNLTNVGDPAALKRLTIEGVAGEDDRVTIDFDAHPGLLNVDEFHLNLGGDVNDSLNIIADGHTLVVDLLNMGNGSIQIGSTTIYFGVSASPSLAAHVSLVASASPGPTSGVLQIVGDLTIAADETYVIELSGTSAGVGTGFHDQVVVTGEVSIASNVTLAVDLLSGFAPTEGDSFEVITNDESDAVNGMFSGLSEGATLSIGGLRFSISYVGGDGNDVVLTTLAPVPPSLTGITINDGEVQRSGIVSITAQFDQPVNVSSDALSLFNETTSMDFLEVSAPTGIGTDTITWTFLSTSLTNGEEDASNGVYLATLDHREITSAVGSHTMSNGVQFRFHRLLGDLDGDGTTSLGDYFEWFNHRNDPEGEPFAKGDVDGDGFHTLGDYFVWFNQRNQDLMIPDSVRDSTILEVSLASIASRPVHLHTVDPLANTASQSRALAGDINLDGTLNAKDVEALYSHVENNIYQQRFDVNGDGHLDVADIDHWRKEIFGAIEGDANLDGNVDFSDFLILSANFGQHNSSWDRGDFDLNGHTEFSDFLLMSANFGPRRYA